MEIGKKIIIPILVIVILAGIILWLFPVHGKIHTVNLACDESQTINVKNGDRSVTVKVDDDSDCRVKLTIEVSGEPKQEIEIPNGEEKTLGTGIK